MKLSSLVSTRRYISFRLQITGLSPRLDQIRRLLRNGVHGRLQVVGRDDGHDRRINNAQLLGAVHQQIRADAPARLLRHHRAAAAGVRERRAQQPRGRHRREEGVLGVGGRARRGLGRRQRRERARVEEAARPLHGGEELRAVEGVLQRAVRDDGAAGRVARVEVDGAARQRLLHRVGHEAGAGEGELDGRDAAGGELLGQDVALGLEAFEEGAVGVDGGEVRLGDLLRQGGDEGRDLVGDGVQRDEGDAVALGAGVGAGVVGEVLLERFGVEGCVAAEGVGVGEGVVHCLGSVFVFMSFECDAYGSIWCRQRGGPGSCCRRRQGRA